MRIFKRLVVFITVFSVSILTAKGAITCDTATTAKLNREVANIRASYEVLERPISGDIGLDWFDPETMTEDDLPRENYFKVNITNISENFYVEITNDIDDEKVTLTYNDSVDGVASFDWENLYQVSNLTIKIYTTVATGCADSQFKTMTLRLPRFNKYSQYAVCQQIPEHYLCQPFVTYKESDNLNFYSAIAQAIEEKEEKEEQENKKDKSNFFKDNLKIIVIGGIILLVGAGATATVIIIKRRRG